jgi:hypothetical protein
VKRAQSSRGHECRCADVAHRRVTKKSGLSPSAAPDQKVPLNSTLPEHPHEERVRSMIANARKASREVVAAPTALALRACPEPRNPSNPAIKPRFPGHEVC